MRDLPEIRKDIDAIDNQLIELFKRRMNCAKEVACYKTEHNIPILNQQRENEILADVEAKGGEYGAAAKELFAKLMELSRDLQHDIIKNGSAIRTAE